ncbi:MAG: uracil phosphoribosyltransferase [Bacteroidota bacterium]
MVKILGEKNSILNQFIAEIRDAEIQKDSMRFRRNFERMGEIFAYEISKVLDYQLREVHTPLGVAEVPVLKTFPVLATILRAGLPFHQGFLNMFDQSENAFVTAYRYHHKDGHFDIRVEYTSSPDLTDRVLIIVDPMLATGSSLELAYKSLLEKGKPKHIHIVAVIASHEGVEFVKKKFAAATTTLWIGAVDDELTAQSYIVPGLGDAGDLAYGKKI